MNRRLSGSHGFWARAALGRPGEVSHGRAAEGAARRSRPAFTMVELLIGLMLTVMIMGAVGLAVKGAADATKYGNEKTRSLAQTTLALARLCTDLRRAEVIELESPQSVRLTLPDGTQHRYTWSGTDGAALCYTQSEGPPNRVLVPSVATFSLEVVEEYSEVAGAVVPVLVKVTLAARCGEATTRLETSVRPRRNIM